jgi:hypothetical protein
VDDRSRSAALYETAEVVEVVGMFLLRVTSLTLWLIFLNEEGQTEFYDSLVFLTHYLSP